MITEKYIDNYFKYILDNQVELSINEGMVRKVLATHLTNIPKGKLYKYRTCSRKNFKTLRDGNIFMPPASGFSDIFDYTLNMDLSQDIDRIQEWFLAHLKEFAWHIILKPRLQKYVADLITYEDFSNAYEKHIDGVDNFEQEIFEMDLERLASEPEKQLYASVASKLQDIKNDKDGELTKICKNILYTLNQAKIYPRSRSLVYCMSEDVNCAPMWENYSGYYTGFCIEYDFTNLESYKFEDIKNLIYMLPVQYTIEKPHFDAFPFFVAAIHEFVFEERAEFDQEMYIALNKQLLYKSTDFDYEKEWRFSIKNNDNNIQPFPFVSGIYMGKDIKENNIKHLKVIAKKLKVPLYQQQVNIHTNKFEYNLIVI